MLVCGEEGGREGGRVLPLLRCLLPCSRICSSRLRVRPLGSLLALPTSNHTRRTNVGPFVRGEYAGKRWFLGTLHGGEDG